MIPILFEKSATTFTTNGLGRLSGAVSCRVTEERNGIYELEMEYPVSGVNFSQIQVGQIIASTHDEAGDLQPFDIYMISQPIDGIVTVYAHHISYRLNEIVVEPFTATTCANAIAGLKTNSIGTNSFTFSTDKTVTADYKLIAPATLRGLLGGQENSLLDVYGTGEYKFDNFSVSLMTNRGSDTDVSIRYGKNLVEFENELDYSNSYNAVVPFWLGQEYNKNTGKSTDVLVTLSEKYISSNNTLPNGRTVYVPLDLSGGFETKPTETELRTLATSELSASNAWLPSQNIKVDFIQLWQTDEYKNYIPLQKVSLCDTVLVSVPMYNISDLRIKVIKVVWNTLLDRYDEMELGTPSATLGSVFSNDYDNKFDSTQNELNMLREALSGQIDSKIETWTMSSNPAVDWTTQDLRDLHNGDLWLYTGTANITVGGVTIHPQGVYQYNAASGTWAAYSSTSSNVFDLIDGKTTIFYGTNTGTYTDVQTGDYLVDSTNGKTYRWNGSAWVLMLDYKTYTNGAVSDAKAVRTEIQYCLSNSNSSFVAYGSWSTTLPTYVAGKYYWVRTVVYYGDGTDNSSTTVPRLYQTGQTATETQMALNSTNNHFWFDNTGAYVTEDDGTYATGYATRITNAGILQSYNGNTMSSWTNSGVNFYESGGTGVTIAEFGSSEARIGKATSDNIKIDTNGLQINKGSTEVGALKQVTGYEPEWDETTYNNALFLETPDYFAIRLDSSVPTGDYEEASPVFETDGHSATINLGQKNSTYGGTALVMTDGGGASNNPVVSLQNYQWNRTNTGAYFEALNENHAIRCGIGSNGATRGLYDEAGTGWLIGINADGEAFSKHIQQHTTSAGSNVRIDSSILRRYVSSSRRYKEDIDDLTDKELDADKLYDVRVRQFRYKDDYLDSSDQRYKKLVCGFIAEELEEAYPIAVNYTDDKPEDWEPKFLIPPMLKLIQKQHEQIETLTKRIEALERMQK